MRLDDLDTKMRKFETIGEIKVPEEAYIILRLDGKGFSRLTELYNFEKPFDSTFKAIMVETAGYIFKEFEGLYAFTESDEISILFPQSFNLYNRELAKLVSISAGLASSAFCKSFYDRSVTSGTSREDCIRLNNLPVFDSRVWCSENPQRVIDYFRWRQADSKRCALNGYTYWTLRKKMSASQATSKMNKANNEFKLNILSGEGVNFDEVPRWQVNGVGLYWESYIKEATHGLTGEPVLAHRRRLRIDNELPMGDDYSSFIKEFIYA